LTLVLFLGKSEVLALETDAEIIDTAEPTATPFRILLNTIKYGV
jgi:hypothetical protein